jgi:hypothetical protein
MQSSDNTIEIVMKAGALLRRRSSVESGLAILRASTGTDLLKRINVYQ